MDAYRYTWFEGLVERAFRERQALSRFDRVNHEYVAEKFRELDRLVIEHNRARLAHAHWRGVPTHEAGGQLGTLKREIQKKRRHLPIRQLLRRAGDAIQAIKPVFMMSPLSIANFLEPGALDFDLVVFDEASQVRPVEAPHLDHMKRYLKEFKILTIRRSRGGEKESEAVSYALTFGDEGGLDRCLEFTGWQELPDEP